MHPAVFEVVIFVFIIWLTITQVIIPKMTNTPTFPSFRLKAGIKKVREADLVYGMEELEKKAAERRREAAALRQQEESDCAE